MEMTTYNISVSNGDLTSTELGQDVSPDIVLSAFNGVDWEKKVAFHIGQMRQHSSNEEPPSYNVISSDNENWCLLNPTRVSGEINWSFIWGRKLNGKVCLRERSDFKINEVRALLSNFLSSENAVLMHKTMEISS